MSALVNGRGITLTISSGTPSADALISLMEQVIKEEQRLVDEGKTTSPIVGGGDEITYLSYSQGPHLVHKWTAGAGTDIDADTFVLTYDGNAATVADLP
jgi:hypothetical protein